MSKSRNDDDAYKANREAHLKSLVTAHSSRRSNAEPPRVLRRQTGLFNQPIPEPAPPPEPQTADKEISDEGNGCWACKKKK